MFKQSISLIAIALMISMSGGTVDAREVEVKAGNVEVSVQNGRVQVDNGSTSIRTPSLLERLTGLRLFNGSSSRTKTRAHSKCDRVNNSSSSHHTSNTGISQSSSSSTTMTCN